MCYDSVFKAIFINEENLLAKMVSDITGIDYELLKDNVILEINELPISTKTEKAKRCDFVLRILDDKIINLELNANKYAGLIIKNLSYLCSLFATSTKRGEEYNEDMLVMQINLNCYPDNQDKALSKYLLQEEDTHKIYLKNIVIFDLNIVKCEELYYNLDNQENIPNYIKWGALIYCNNFENIPNIINGIMTDKERERIMGKLDKLTREDLFYTEEEALEWAEWERRSIATEERNKGIQEGYNQGINEGIEQTIKNMFQKKNMSFNDISDITGKTIDEIEKIIKK